MSVFAPRVPGRPTLVAVALASCSLALPCAPAQGQGYAREVVQPLPDPATAKLNEALQALSRDPQSLSALIDAGQASLKLDSLDAALGFFHRAEAIAPRDGRVKAGLASILVRQQQPVEALRLFAEAEAAGEPMAAHAAERGLAYDLVGANARAQEDYRVALAQGENPVVTRRLALSQAIAGDQRASEATLLPLLQHSDLAAYRTRAFALAILGKSEEAVSIAETMLPARLANRMSPYLRFMPRLTKSQQAAAANLGVFPQAAEIGRDGPALAGYAEEAGGPPQARGADARLVPAGEPLGSNQRTAAAPPQEPTARGGEISVSYSPLPQETPAPQSAPPAAPPPAAASPPELAAAANPEPGPSISLAAQSAAPAEPAPVEVFDLDEVFADFSLAESRVERAPGAVDITRIEPKRDEPPPPPPPAYPSRQWVQVATGRDVAALAFDWRRIKRAAGGLLDKPAPHVVDWGQTHRLVAGPFASAREAQDMVSELKEKGVDSFRFTSARGEEVRPLD